MKLFSVDDHIIEPANLWTSRVSSKYQDVVPQIVQKDGKECWAYEDQFVYTLGLNAVVGKPEEEWDFEPTSFNDMRRGCFDPRDRVRDFLSEGITASVGFPTLPRFGGALFPGFKDKVLADLCVRAWNDYVFEEWCAAAPEVYVPMTIIQLWDPQQAVREIERNLARGVRAITIPEESSQLGFGLPSYYDEYWNPVWAACQDADLPICMHIGSSGWKPFIPPGAGDPLLFALGFVPTVTHAMAMAFGPVPRKFPNIKFVFSEGGIGWIPQAVERADHRYTIHRHWSGSDDLKPSEVFQRNFWFCMMPDEDYGLNIRHEIGIDKIFWESDYPHANCPWPATQDIVHRFFDGVPADEVKAITYGNAQNVFKWSCLEVEELIAKGYSADRAPVGV